MPGNPFNNPTIDMMYSDAVMGLMNGCLMSWDKQVLAAAPIPSSVIEPYMEKEIPDVRESMRLTYETMVVWIDEAKKVNYFSKRFVQLSKMIMNGVTTMGRGLITLHARREEPAGVPMSIQDLIGVASYHFRKSHLGVLQTVRSHPEISERLLMNQISWNNMLMRLFKTKEKLAKPVLNEEVRMKNEENDTDGSENGNPKPVSDIITNDEEILKAEEMPDGNSDPSSFLPLHSLLDDGAPPYLKILQNVYARSGPTDDGKLNFTFDEVCYLAADPDFARIYPGAAEHMRTLLDRLDTGCPPP